MAKPLRQKKVVELIARHGECSIEELAHALSVSEMTIRRDLQTLSENGKIIRTHGGAAMSERVSFEFGFLKRTEENKQAKEAIAGLAATKLDRGSTVLLDSGTTTLAIANELRAMRDLRVVTTSLPVAATLQFSPNIEVLLLGGYLRESTPDLSGAMTEANLDTLRTDVAFLGTQGIDREGILYQDTHELASLVAKMSHSAEQVYVVADHSKFGQTALCRSGQLQDYAGLMTDSGGDQPFVTDLQQLGVQIFIAE